jgi:NMD protein affecting ribosome stability and mRNA decay
MSLDTGITDILDGTITCSECGKPSDTIQDEGEMCVECQAAADESKYDSMKENGYGK